VGQPDRSRKAPGGLEFVFKIDDTPNGAADVHAAIHDRDTRRVVPPILQALQPLDQNLLGGLAPDVGDDTAHKPTSLFACAVRRPGAAGI
jgi:hypothetical protein